MGEEEQLRRAVMILLDNAIKYTPENGWIQVSLKQHRHQIEFQIQNSCYGISAENLPKLFDRFYRADTSRNSESGSYGLGLPIAKAILAKAGGRIYAESAEGEWALFGFQLKRR